MKAFSFIPLLEIWTISNHTGIGDTNVHACRIYIYRIYSGLAWGVVLSRVMGLSRTSKTDNSNSSHAFFFVINFPFGGWGELITNPMKKVSLFAAICFCLWFIADLISVIGYTVTYVESNGIERLLSSLNVIYFVQSVIGMLAVLSGFIFFLTLYRRQK